MPAIPKQTARLKQVGLQKYRIGKGVANIVGLNFLWIPKKLCETIEPLCWITENPQILLSVLRNVSSG